MKLHAFDWIPLMAEAHDSFRPIRLGRPGAHFEFGRQVLFLHDERVITGCGEWRLKVFEDRSSVMLHLTRFAVHKVGCAYDFPAESSPQSLMAQADAQNRQFAGQMPEKIDADTCLLWGTRPGRDHNTLRAHGLNFFDRDLVVAADYHFRTQFAQILHQVVGERIVIIEHKHHTYSSQVTS